MKVDMEGKTALITGSASGIGRETAKIFARNGAAVIINDTDEGKGISAAEEINKQGGTAMFIKADVSDREQVGAMVERAVGEFGKIDVLVNNAGINIAMDRRGPVHEFPDDMWQRIVDIDLNGVYYCSKAVLRHMVKKGYGKIINISSIVGSVPLRNQCAFAAAKAAVINLTKAMAIELAEHGINVNAILPGSIDINRSRDEGLYAGDRYRSIISHIPFKRPGTPEDIGNGALYLASDAAGYVTGNILVIDGGWTCGFARDW